MDDNKWILRSEKGKITGPFTTREILQKIKRNEISGAESISKYPGGEWRPISHNSEFYDFLLSHLSQAKVFDDDETNWDITPDTKSLKSKSNIPEKSLSKDDVEETPEFPKDDELIPSKVTHKQQVFKDSDGFDFSKNIVDKIKKEEKHRERKQAASSQKSKKHKKPKKKKKSLLPLITIIAVAAAIIYVLGTVKLETLVENHVQLLVPVENIQMKPEDVKEVAEQGIRDFTKDTFQGYMSAQKKFVQVLEADKTYGDIFSLLCLSHYNLWNFTSKNATALKKIISVVKLVEQFDPRSLNFYNCNNSYLILSGNTEKAYENLKSIIDKNADSQSQPTFSYYLLTKLLQKDQKYSEAIEYAERLNSVWSEWAAGDFLKAQLYFEFGERDKAIQSFKNILSVNPNNKKARVYIGMMRNKFYKQFEKSQEEIKASLKMRGRLDPNIMGLANYYLADSSLQMDKMEAAQKYSEMAYKFFPTDKKIESLYVNFFGEEGKVTLSDISYVQQGDQLFASKDYNAAQAYYKEALKINNKNTEAAIKAAKSLEKLNLGEESVEILKRSLSINPESVYVSVLLARFYMKQFKYQEAFEVLNTTHKKVRGHYKIYLMFAEVELEQQHFIGAIKYADKSLKIYGENAQAFVIKGRTYLLMNENKKAYSEFLRAIDLEPSNTTANAYFIKAYYRVLGMDAAVRRAKKLIAQDETQLAYHQVLGELYYEDEQFTQAERKFKQIIEIDNKYVKAYIWLADTYRQLRQLNDAKVNYFKAVNIDLQNSEPQLKLGLLYLETKNFKKAIDQFKNIMRLNENVPKVKFYYAKSLFHLKQYQKALELLKKEKIANPSNVESYLLAGEIYEILGQYLLCKREFQQALKYREFGPAFYILVSRCHRKSGSLDVAVNMLEKARGLSPNLPDIYRELGAVYEAKSDTEKAVWSYERYLFLAPTAVDFNQISNKVRNLSN